MTLVHQQLQKATALLQETLQATRHLSTMLRPTVLKDLGLEAALREHLTEFAQRSGVRLRTVIAMNDETIPFDTARHVYRIVQEALTNVARHAAALLVTVELRRSAQGLVVAVTDDGKGFDLAQATDGQSLGLIGMQERAQLIGGVLDIRSALGRGTVVTLLVPLTKGERPDDSSAACG
jgi:signal transduction histidine kinase